jgi:hypothetical protein
MRDAVRLTPLKSGSVPYSTAISCGPLTRSQMAMVRWFTAPIIGPCITRGYPSRRRSARAPDGVPSEIDIHADASRRQRHPFIQFNRFRPYDLVVMFDPNVNIGLVAV